MLTKRFVLIEAVMLLVVLALQPLAAQTSGDKSESERIARLERAIEQLQNRNFVLEK